VKTGVRGLMGLVLAGVLAMTGAPTAVADEVVTIPDAALAACITRNLTGAGLPADLSAANVAKLTKLACTAADGVVADLTGVDTLVGLTSVTLRMDGPLDLGPLTTLPKLISLTLNLGQVTRVEVPGSLRLNSLVLSTRETHLPVTSVLDARTVTVSGQFLETLDGLGPIEADYGRVYSDYLTDVRALATATVDDLIVQGAAGLDLRGVGEVSGVRTLAIQRKVASYAGLAGLDTLRTLTLKGVVGASDLKTLPELPALDKLTVTASNLTALPSLDNLPALASLTINADSQFTSLGDAGSLKRLHEIHARSAALADISALSGSSGLTTVDLAYNLIVDISPLAGDAALATADLSGNRIVDISPLAGASALTSLNLYSNRIVDASPLAGLTSASINLSSNRIADVSPFAHFVAGSLNLSDDRITDISTLTGLGDGIVLNLASNAITDFSALTYWTGQLSATGQYIALPDAVAGVPYPMGRALKGADGKDLLQLRGSLVDGFLRYDTSGWFTSYFANATVESSATITVRLVQQVAWGPSTTPSPSPSPSPDPSAGSTPPGSRFSWTPAPVIPDLVVGRSVTAIVTQWTPAATQLSFQWYTAGPSGSTAIPGATSPTFTPGPGLAGAWVFLVVTGSREGLLPAQAFSSAVNVAYLEYSSDPQVSLGTAGQVAQGSVLKAVGHWPQGTTVTFRWDRDGVQIGGSGPSYATVPNDAGHTISVTATVSQAGYRTVERRASISVAYAQFANRTPTISGTARVGHILKAKTAWPKAAVQTCKWYHYGVRIPGASACTYKVRKSDRGKRMRVLVKVSMPGYATMERWSRPKTVH